MIAASANKVTVPGDNRLDELKLGNKTPFWHKIPIIKELRVAVGWQKGMLITGLVLTAFFLLVAIFAPLIAPYSYAQLKGADGVSFPAQAAPSSSGAATRAGSRRSRAPGSSSRRCCWRF